ncbi:MAG: hypothetical protein ACTSUE_01390 [Promethearchaeota archaeon]
MQRLTNGHLFDLAYRSFGTSAGVTTRPELKNKIIQLNKESPELMSLNKRALLRFYLHGRHDNIRFCSKPGAKGFLVKEGGDGKRPPRAKKIRGIHSLLKKIFYPEFDYKEHSALAKKAQTKARKKASAKGGRTSSSVTKEKKKNVITIPYRSSIAPSGCAWNMVDMVARDKRGVGSELGTQIHEQLELFARDRRMFDSEIPVPDPYVSEIIKKIIKEWELVPLWSEYEVWDETLKYATSVDMICFHPKKKRFAFFEVKTGYRDSFAFSTGKKIRGRFGIDSHPLNHAILQMLLPIETMKRHYGIKAIDGYVLHVNASAGVKVYRVPTNTQLPRDRLYNYVIRMNRKEEREKEQKRNVASKKRRRESASVLSSAKPRQRLRNVNRITKKRRNTVTYPSFSSGGGMGKYKSVGRSKKAINSSKKRRKKKKRISAISKNQ